MELRIRDDVVGFGEPSKRGRTVNGNYFVRVTTTPVANGADVVLEARHGLTFSDGSARMALHLRSDHGPRIGERVMVHGRLIKVADKRFDGAGRVQLFDEDTGAWCVWEG